MHKLLDKLNSSKMVLISSIPENTYEMAKAAWEAGADAIKVHMNVFHRASQNTFGSLEEMRPVFEKILKDSPVPVGIVPGQNTFVAESMIDEVVKMGFDFVSLYGFHTPASLMSRHDISKFYSFDSSFTMDEINFSKNSGLVDILELSICVGETYGERLNGRDILKYKRIACDSPVPCVVPTQRVVKPSDIPLLYDCGVKALMVGAITYGKTIDSVTKSLKEFRNAIDQL